MEVKVASYVVPVAPVALKLVRSPPDTLIAPTSKSVVASFDMNVRDKDPSLLNPPLATSEALMLIVGSVVSYVQLKMLDAVLLLPAVSVNSPPLI